MLKIIILGSGNAFAHANQFQSAHYIEFNEKDKILLDCGPAILQAMQSAEVNINNLKYLLISHLHGDHMAGIPFLLLHYKFLSERKEPLHIIGPSGLKEQLSYLLKGNYPSILTEDDALFDVCELKFQVEKELVDSIIIKTFEAHHIPNALGYTIRKDNLKIVYSGDNELKEDQLEEFKDSTVLIHELTTMESAAGGHTSWNIMKEYIDEILNSVGKVIVVHTSADVREEPEKTFESKIIRAQDGSEFLFNEKGRLYQMVL